MIEKLISRGPDLQLEKLAAKEGITVLYPPSVELFLAGLQEGTSIPTEFAHNSVLIGQASQRRELYLSLGAIFEKMTDYHMDIHDALLSKHIETGDAIELYGRLDDFLKTDDHNGRIILYLPFQFLPDLCKHSENEMVKQAQEKFAQSYKKAWIRLLFESEVRGSFVDGEVLEPGLGKPPRVRKAGHLIPEILQRGLIDTSDVIEILELSDEEELLQSLTEGVMAAEDRKLFSEEDWQRIEAIAGTKLAISKILNASLSKDKSESIGDDEEINIPLDKFLKDLATRLEADLAELERKYAPGSPYTATISHKRAVWEKQVRGDKIIDHIAKQAALRLQTYGIAMKDIERFCQREGFDEGFTVAGLRSVVLAGKALAVSNISSARELAKQYHPLIQKFWGCGSDAVKDEIISGLSHWARLGITSEETLKSLGISLTDLSALLPVDLGDLYSKDLKEIAQASKKIEEDPYLSQYVYPFFIAFGSRVKGQAKSNADLDLGIFMKPDAPWGKREEIFDRLRKVVPKLGSIEETPEFWLENKNGRYNFRAVSQKEDGLIVIGAPLIHFLLGGVWFGRGEEINQIQRDILGRYLNLDRMGEQKERVRFNLLRQLEMDVIQYRIMHKGYRWLYPNKRDKGSVHSNLIDWESDFWDPGYRRVATQLFVSRLFLPDIRLDDIRGED